MVNTPAPPIRTQENVNATRSSQEVNSTRTMSLALVPMEQNLHLTGTVTDFAFGVGITAFIQIGYCWRPGRPQCVRRKPVDLRCLEVPKANPRQRFVAGLGHRGPPPGSRPVIKSCMVFTWTEVLPASIRSLPPLHRETVEYIMGCSDAGYALAALRLYFWRYGITTAADLGYPIDAGESRCAGKSAAPDAWIYGLTGLDRRCVYRRRRERYR